MRMDITNKNTCNRIMYFLQSMGQYIAILVGVSLIVAAMITIFHSYAFLLQGSVERAVQDGLFVLILLELFYVVRSFVKYNSVNVGLIVNVGIIAGVKQVVFQLEFLTWQLAIAFAVIFLSLGVLYWMESQYYRQQKEEGQELLLED